MYIITWEKKYSLSDDYNLVAVYETCYSYILKINKKLLN